MGVGRSKDQEPKANEGQRIQESKNLLAGNQEPVVRVEVVRDPAQAQPAVRVTAAEARHAHVAAAIRPAGTEGDDRAAALLVGVRDPEREQGADVLDLVAHGFQTRGGFFAGDALVELREFQVFDDALPLVLEREVLAGDVVVLVVELVRLDHGIDALIVVDLDRPERTGPTAHVLIERIRILEQALEVVAIDAAALALRQKFGNLVDGDAAVHLLFLTHR